MSKTICQAVFKPPARWKEMLNTLRTFRATFSAEVDTMGCGRLFDDKVSAEEKRYHILVALMLSSQTKDTVNAAAMQSLLRGGLTPHRIISMPASELDGHIRKVSFHNVKTKHLKEVAHILLQDYNGTVPREYEELTSLPGVGPKMAHLFLQEADNRVLGIGVDTHVHRISQRLCWVPKTVKSPEDTRKQLESWLPKEHWCEINLLLVGLGQRVCRPIGPRCQDCRLAELCPNAFKETKSSLKRKRGSVTTSLVDIEDSATVASSEQKPEKRLASRTRRSLNSTKKQ